jgi:hypothetical protein
MNKLARRQLKNEARAKHYDDLSNMLITCEASEEMLDGLDTCIDDLLDIIHDHEEYTCSAMDVLIVAFKLPSLHEWLTTTTTVRHKVHCLLDKFLRGGDVNQICSAVVTKGLNLIVMVINDEKNWDKFLLSHSETLHDFIIRIMKQHEYYSENVYDFLDYYIALGILLNRVCPSLSQKEIEYISKSIDLEELFDSVMIEISTCNCRESFTLILLSIFLLDSRSIDLTRSIVYIFDTFSDVYNMLGNSCDKYNALFLLLEMILNAVQNNIIGSSKLMCDNLETYLDQLVTYGFDMQCLQERLIRLRGKYSRQMM